MYLLALIVPPLAVLCCGKPGQAVLNLILWCLGLVPGIIHGFMVVSEYKADKRQERLLKGIAQMTRR